MRRRTEKQTSNVITKAQESTIQSLISKGYPPAAIASKLKVTRTAVNKYAVEAGLIEPVKRTPIVMKRSDQVKNKRKRAKELLRDGHSRVSVAERFGLKLAEVREIQQELERGAEAEKEAQKLSEIDPETESQEMAEDSEVTESTDQEYEENEDAEEEYETDSEDEGADESEESDDEEFDEELDDEETEDYEPEDEDDCESEDPEVLMHGHQLVMPGSNPKPNPIRVAINALIDAFESASTSKEKLREAIHATVNAMD